MPLTNAAESVVPYFLEISMASLITTAGGTDSALNLSSKTANPHDVEIDEGHTGQAPMRALRLDLRIDLFSHPADAIKGEVSRNPRCRAAHRSSS